jgi:hypothetical protein
LFTAGNEPGKPMQIGQTLVFGSSPKMLATTEHLGVGVQLNVNLKTNHNLELLKSLFVLHKFGFS